MSDALSLAQRSRRAKDDLAARSKRAVWHPCTQMQRLEAEPALPIARAEGPWLFDAEGRKYLDAVSSWWVNLFGHNHPALRAALLEQFQTVDHVMLAGLTHEPVVELSERLGAATGLGHAFYGSDGASATEIALKMSAHSWRNLGRPQKCEFIGLAGGYHGETVGALSVTDIALFREAYAPLVRLSAVMPSPDARLAADGEDARAVALRCAAALEAHLEQHHERIAAFIVEPLIQCATGFAFHDAEYLRRARELCDRYQVHLICDEIAVGFGRTGTLFAHQQAGIRPDFICLSKGLTGGTLPLSVVLTTDAVYQSFYDERASRGFLHSHSYTGNPLACRMALTVLELFEQQDVLARNRVAGDRLEALLRPLREHRAVRHPRRRGMIWAFDIAGAPPGFSGTYHLAARERGLLLRPIADTLYLMPPYVLDDTELQHLADGSLAALDAVLGR